MVALKVSEGRRQGCPVPVRPQNDGSIRRRNAPSPDSSSHSALYDSRRPRIRTTIFLNGCPDGLLVVPEPGIRATCRPHLFFDASKVRVLRRLRGRLPKGAISLHDGRSWTLRSLCDGTGQCVNVCPREARTIMGRRVTAGEAFDDAAADACSIPIRAAITISGRRAARAARVLNCAAPPGARREFLRPSIRAATRPGEVARGVLEQTDLCSAGPQAHGPGRAPGRHGVPLAPILDNARRIHRELRIPLRIRVPIIPGMNDTAEGTSKPRRASWSGSWRPRRPAPDSISPAWASRNTS